MTDHILSKNCRWFSDILIFAPSQAEGLTYYSLGQRPGGLYLFFNENGRAFCLYVVAGGRASLPRIVTKVNGALAALHIGPDAMTATLSERVVESTSGWLGADRPAQLPRARPRSSARRSPSIRSASCCGPAPRTRSLCGPAADCGSGWSAMCCSVNGGAEHVPARLDPRRLVEGRQLRLLRRRPALLHRLQRDVRFVRLRRRAACARPAVQNCGCHCNTRLVRPAARVLQPVPLRAVPSRGALRRRGRVPRRLVRAAVGVRPHVHDDERDRRTRPRCTTRRACTARAAVADGVPPLRQGAATRAHPTALLNAPVVGHGRDADRATATGSSATDGGVFTLRRREVPRLDGRQAPEPPIVDIARDADRQGLLARRERRRHLHASATRGFHGSTGGKPLNQPIVGMAAHADRQRLLARRERRRHLLASATRKFYGSTGGKHAQPADRRHGRDADAARATGSSPPTAASSRSATPSSTARWAAMHLQRADRRDGAARRAARATGWSAADGGVFAFGDAQVPRQRRPQRRSRRGRHGDAADAATATGSSADVAIAT